MGSNGSIGDILKTSIGVAENLLENWLTRPRSRLLINSDSAGWVLDTEARGLLQVCGTLGIPARIGLSLKRNQACVHYLSQFALENPDVYLGGQDCRYSVAYFHGGPDKPDFRKLFGILVDNKERLTKVHVSNTLMKEHCLDAGYRADQIAQIPIGINIPWFSVKTEDSKRKMREKLGISREAFVVGSFQKDGVGWGEGLEPKLIKGPDLFIDTMRAIKSKVPELHVLLSGAARGYVKKNLTKLKIPYTMRFYNDPRKVAELYNAIDVYLISSRVEGGPKAILESMASGTPLVSSNVGQAVDLVRHGETGWLTEVGDVESMAEGALKAYEDSGYYRDMLAEGRRIAESEDYLAQAPRWRELFFKNYVDGYDE